MLSGTNPEEEAAKAAAKKALEGPVPALPTKAESARNVSMMGIASYNRTVGRPSTIFSSPSPEDRLHNLLG
jgi:hypothetical protein